jgi:hypothetical protein
MRPSRVLRPRLQPAQPLKHTQSAVARIRKIHFADDAFIDRFFDDAPADFYADALPPALSGAFSIGADQLAS